MMLAQWRSGGWWVVVRPISKNSSYATVLAVLLYRPVGDRWVVWSNSVQGSMGLACDGSEHLFQRCQRKRQIERRLDQRIDGLVDD